MTSLLNLQPTHLKNEFVTLIPLQENDFDKLYQVASDPLIWEQHPTKNRYEKEVFQNYFSGAIESKGAFLVLDSKNDEVIGSSRFTEYDVEKKSLQIGYTFLARRCWGLPYNYALKTAMLDHAFSLVDEVYFFIGACNIRSQKAIEKLGAVKVRTESVAYFGEESNENFVYKIDKLSWAKFSAI